MDVPRPIGRVGKPRPRGLAASPSFYFLCFSWQWDRAKAGVLAHHVKVRGAGPIAGKRRAVRAVCCGHRGVAQGENSNGSIPVDWHSMSIACSIGEAAGCRRARG